MISKYLDDKNQVLKQPSSAAVQERKRMKIELTNEGIKTVKWYNEERTTLWIG